MSTRTEDPQAPLAPRQSEPGIVTGESGTCVVSVVFANELEVTLSVNDPISLRIFRVTQAAIASPCDPPFSSGASMGQKQARSASHGGQNNRSMPPTAPSLHTRPPTPIPLPEPAHHPSQPPAALQPIQHPPYARSASHCSMPTQPPLARLAPTRSSEHTPISPTKHDCFDDQLARHAQRSNRDHPRRRVSGPNNDVQGGVLVGNLIGEGHVNYVLMYNMLTGIRIGVSRCQAKVRRPLTDADYTARHKFTFDVVGNELTPSAKYDFKFKDYAPWVFRELREYFHLDPADYLLSLTAKYILSELGSPGKSGSFFYFSRDYRFIIKTIHPAENKFLRSILKDYHEHVKANPHTLLSRFYGLHRVKLPRGPKIHFVIMNNLFPPHRDIHETFDLKGSAVGREYPEEKAKAGSVLKDLNWIHRGRKIELGPTKKGLFEEQLKRDTSLLQHLGIMDYSLLIGLHDMARGNSEGLRDDQLRVFQPVADGQSPAAAQPLSNSSLVGAASASSHPAAGPSTASPPGGVVVPAVVPGVGSTGVSLGGGGSLHRKSTTTKRGPPAASGSGAPAAASEQELAASALRKAIHSSDPQIFAQYAHRLPAKDRFIEKKKFIFYQDEGGFMASDDANAPLPVIYYLGIIDILTPYSFVKKFEHFWKGMSHDKEMISAVPPGEYGDRFLNFLFSVIRGGDPSLRPRMHVNPPAPFRFPPHPVAAAVPSSLSSGSGALHSQHASSTPTPAPQRTQHPGAPHP
ncbi:hypothetical protein PtA15_2A164 [Puccinia triticina]|uniref:PIPK domain-containing protein n=1 Tax=Puccinia triticina TaxID=208348 RepID=A0ABY7CCH8_9BASI|nr:uncharacterized protein PtA15_2A164 [Puccinia triticina]WAQ81851.1 hypothetical protein PtA15_2A164 [Puccinia triticina]